MATGLRFFPFYKLGNLKAKTLDEVRAIATVEEPPPKKQTEESCHDMAILRIWDTFGAGTMPLVVEGMKARKEMGFDRYGSYLGRDNGRNPFVDSAQEMFDLLAYLEQGDYGSLDPKGWASLVQSAELVISLALEAKVG